MPTPQEFVLANADAYLHGLLTAEESARFEQFCEQYPVCQAALAEAQRRYEAMSSLPPIEAPERLVKETTQNIEARAARRQSSWKILSRTVLALATAAVVVIGACHWYYLNLRPSPYDLRILGQSDLLAGADAGLRIGIFDVHTARPLANVPVEVLLKSSTGQEISLAKFDTGAAGDGAPQLALPDWPPGEYELKVVARPNGKREELAKTITLARSWKLMLSADKPVYKPGQVIHLRSLALRRPDLKPVTGEEVLFTVTDPKGNMIFKERSVASKFGIASVDCLLASETLLGAYNIDCIVGDSISSKTVEVQEYVLPKFKISVNIDEPFYEPGDEVIGSVQANYFTEQPVAGGEVKIKVHGRDAAVYEIATLDLKTDDNGKAEFRFTLPEQFVGREQEGGNAAFQLTAEVTDTAGQNYATSASRLVAGQPIQIDVLPEAGALVKDVPNTIYLYASYADGRPVRKGRVLVSGINEELITSDIGIASFEVTPQGEEEKYTISASDSQGRQGRRHVRLAAGQVAGDFLVRPDQSVYDGTASMQIAVLGGGVEPVFVDILKEGQTMLTQTIDMQAGKGAATFDLPPDLFGTLRLVAYRFGKSGLAVRKERTIFVRQARELKISATLDEKEYKPGDTAQITFKLADAEGNPAPGALSLAAVDEAVFSVLTQSTGMQRAFFLLDEELLAPVYAIYDSWMPDLLPELPLVQQNDFEQAVFSRTVNSSTGEAAVPVLFSRGGEGDVVQETPDFNPGEMFEIGEAGVDEAMFEEEVFAPGNVDFGGESSSPWSLAAASFVAKQREVFSQRDVALKMVSLAWVGLVVSLLLVGLVTFAVYHTKAFLITGAVCTAMVVFLAPLALLSVMVVTQSAPKEAMRMMAPAAGAANQAWMDGGEEMAADMAMPMMEMEPGEMAPPEATTATESSSGAAAPPRLRQKFPETMLWRPELVTNDQGEAVLELPLADSITTWRLSASGVTAEGRLGAEQFPIKVFQPFFVDLNLPVALTRNDEVGVPVVVYNYLSKPQTVTLEVQDADWFARLDTQEALGESGEEEIAEEKPASQTLTLELAPSEIRSLNIPLKVLKVGTHRLRVTATSETAADALEREIEVIPDGKKVEYVVSGTLNDPAEMTLTVPQDAIEGSIKALVKIHPSSFSQLVEGLDAIFQMPSGCFEQTSSTTYPNILALDYLKRTGKSVPEVEAKARQYIHVGYQRLVSFEVSGGGFDWFGNPPANRTLTAYGLMEFDDMAQVHDVDPELIERTRNWLLAQRKPNGSWPAEVGMLNDGLAGSVQRGGNLDLVTTAYIAWAVFGTEGIDPSVAMPTLDYLLKTRPDSIDDPYVLSLVISAIAAINENDPALGKYAERLESLKQTSDEGKLVWWDQPAGGQTAFYGSGRSGNIETTAMAVLALMKTGGSPASVRGGLSWLVSQKDASGTWHSTQATVLALKALIQGTGQALGGEKERKFEITLGGESVQSITLPADQGEVMQLINLSTRITPGEHDLTIEEKSDTGSGYQVTLIHYIETPQESDEKEPLSIEIAYDRERLPVDQRATAVATVVNNMEEAAPMVILDLPIPGGFEMEAGELDELVGSKKIEKYQITPRKAIVYLRGLEAGAKLELRYRLRATMPVKATVPPAAAYEYYNPDRRGESRPAALEATEA